MKSEAAVAPSSESSDAITESVHTEIPKADATFHLGADHLWELLNQLLRQRTALRKYVQKNYHHRVQIDKSIHISLPALPPSRHGI